MVTGVVALFPGVIVLKLRIDLSFLMLSEDSYLLLGVVFLHPGMLSDLLNGQPLDRVFL